MPDSGAVKIPVDGFYPFPSLVSICFILQFSEKMFNICTKRQFQLANLEVEKKNTCRLHNVYTLMQS